MEYEWDEAKRLANLKKHGVDFAEVDAFDWIAAQYRTDDGGYAEERFKALGLFRGRVHVVIFTFRGPKTRIISFRKAEKREIRRYEEEKD